MPDHRFSVLNRFRRFCDRVRQDLRYAIAISLAVVGLISMNFATCVAADPSLAGIEFFETRVRPLLAQNCYECHAKREANGGLLLDTRDGLLKGGDSGAAIVPGDPEKSRLIEAVRYKNPDFQMPPKTRLIQADVEILEKWISMQQVLLGLLV